MDRAEIEAIARYKPFKEAQLASAAGFNVGFFAEPLGVEARKVIMGLQTDIDDFHVRAAMREDQLLEFGTYHSDTLPAHVLEAIVRVLPDAGPVLLEEMKVQAAHRRGMERTSAEARERRLDRGQIGAYVLAIAGVATSTAAIIVTKGAFWSFVYATFALAISVGGPQAAKIFLERNRIAREQQAPEES